MDCPSCDSKPLKPLKIEEGLPGYACSDCQGILVDILNYRLWTEKRPDDTPPITFNAEQISDSQRSLLCPKCSSIMLKYRISGNVDNRLDLCSNCGELWLDGGEWHLLAQLDLQSKIPQIVSSPWQQSIRREEIKQSIETKFENLFGKEDYLKIKAFKDWMISNDKSDQIRDYLNRGQHAK